MALNAKQQAILGWAVFQFGARELASLFPNSEEAERRDQAEVISMLHTTITGIVVSATLKGIKQDLRNAEEVPTIPKDLGPEEVIWQIVGQVAESVLSTYRKGWNEDLLDETVANFLKVKPGSDCLTFAF